ncbi:MAG TPA: hypothetical protein VF074_04725, partial [Pyrinomonadaceae bacterium]
LVLSLIVQSIQSIIKKWFKLKSRSILDSLDDLFEYVGSKDITGLESSVLVEEVKKQFGKLGRVSLIRKNPMVDSIAKEDLVKIIGKLAADKIDPAKVTPLQEEVRTWFDTVMQGFEERYTRHMKTVAIIVSVVVVIVLNANFFDIYHNISTNDVLRASLIDKRDEIKNRLGQQPAAPDSDQEKAKAQLKTEIDELQGLLEQAPVFGFTPLNRGDVINFFQAKGFWATHADERFAYFLRLLAGWAIMIMLLSVGAPFWQDALESLFGVKNLLRKKSDTKNVEDVGGQPKP